MVSENLDADVDDDILLCRRLHPAFQLNFGDTIPLPTNCSTDYRWCIFLKRRFVVLRRGHQDSRLASISNAAIVMFPFLEN